MSRASVAERTRLSVFLARGMARKLLGRLTGFSLAGLPFLRGAPDRLLIAPARAIAGCLVEALRADRKGRSQAEASDDLDVCAPCEVAILREFSVDPRWVES